MPPSGVSAEVFSQVSSISMSWLSHFSPLWSSAFSTPSLFPFSYPLTTRFIREGPFIYLRGLIHREITLPTCTRRGQPDPSWVLFMGKVGTLGSQCFFWGLLLVQSQWVIKGLIATFQFGLLPKWPLWQPGEAQQPSADHHSPCWHWFTVTRKDTSQ